jgi:hypothetical protein
MKPSEDLDRIAKLEAIYARVPKMRDCEMKCEDSCTVVPVSPFEKARLEEALGMPFMAIKTPDGKVRCCALKDNRCSVYSIRPLLCRLFGTSKHPFLKCEHGCSPERWLSGEETVSLMLAVTELCGSFEIPVEHWARLSTKQVRCAAKMLLEG